MPNFTITQVDKIVQSCLDLYSKLPKTGKPVEKEWTVLSCVVQYDNINGYHSVVSLGTGSKCIGASKMSATGDVLNDSHAEVFARRGFLLYLYDNIDKILEKTESIFIHQDGSFKLKENLEFIIYSTQLPCGDASIIPKTGDEEHFGDVLRSTKRHADDSICDIVKKKLKSEGDVHRTGAKCLPDLKQDSKQAGTDYHLLGQVRTKPGRGDRTLSVSCSDKIARWIHLGIQGALLDMLLCEPVYITHFIFGAGVPFSIESLNRAFLERNLDSAALESKCVPYFYQCSLPFPDIRTEHNMRPAAASILWSKLNSRNVEVAVQGRKLGMTKKKATLPSNSMCISKYKLYERFHAILHKHKNVKQNVFGEESIEHMPYNEMKIKAKRYMENWKEIREKFFKTWTIKPDIWNFYVNVI